MNSSTKRNPSGEGLPPVCLTLGNYILVLHWPIFTTHSRCQWIYYRAHKALDKTVLSAYGLPAEASDTQILTELFKRYEALTKADQLPLPEKKKTRKRAAKKT